LKAPNAILALDAAGRACSAAVWRDQEIAAARHERMSRGQSEVLVPMIEAVMQQAGQSYAELSAVVVTRGPGGFTGIRIGLAAASGIALAAGAPLVAVTCFEAVAAAVPRPQPNGSSDLSPTLTVVLDAKRSDVYAQLFRWVADSPLPQPLAEPRAIEPASLVAALPRGSVIFAGDAVAQVEPALQRAARRYNLAQEGDSVDAAVVAAMVGSGAVDIDLGKLKYGAKPLYLRPPDVTLPG